jgi:uncharacterized protein (DUF433 family)
MKQNKPEAKLTKLEREIAQKFKRGYNIDSIATDYGMEKIDIEHAIRKALKAQKEI